MSDEIKGLVDDLHSAFEELKKTLDEREQEVKQLGEARAETEQKLEQVQTQIDAVEGRLEKLKLDTKDEDGSSEEYKAFLAWARKGNRVSEDEIKALSVSTDTEGGFLAPAEFLREILKGVVEFSPLRRFARVSETSAQSVKVPKRTGTFSAVWVAEQGTRSETTGLAYGMEEIPTHEAYALVDVSNQLLEDAVFDIEAELEMEYAEQFGVAEGAAFVNGTGVGRPEGFLQHPDVQSITSTTNDVLDEDDFAKLLYALKEPYHARAAWLLNRLTLRDARLLKDANGQFLWQPALALDVPATILGKPYAMATDMPTIANAARALAVGDWSRGYRIVDRISMSVQRDPYTQATSGNTRFIARKRVGGQVVVAEAIKVLTIQ
jgi:HK97 family phage major capsid protein